MQIQKNNAKGLTSYLNAVADKRTRRKYILLPIYSRSSHVLNSTKKSMQAIRRT